MSIDRITHLVEQMHRSEDDAGDPIADDSILAADGSRGLKWLPPGSVGGPGSGFVVTPPLSVPLPARVPIPGTGTMTPHPEGRITDEAGDNRYSQGLAYNRGILHHFYTEGTTEHAAGSAAYHRKSYDYGTTWTTGVAIYSGGGAGRHGNAEGALVTASGRLIVGLQDQDDSDPFDVISGRMYSDNDGETWSSFYTLTNSFSGDCVSASFVQLPRGDILWFAYGEQTGVVGGNTFVRVYRSTDDGETFGDETTVASSASRTYAEPRAVITDGFIVVLMRSDTNVHTWRTESEVDDGVTWSAPADVVALSGPPDVIEFFPGALFAIARNDNTVWRGRYAVSWDLGVTWTSLTELDSGETRELDGTALWLMAPGFIYAIYALATDASNSTFYIRRFYLGYGTDHEGSALLSGLEVSGIPFDLSDPDDGEVLTYDAGSGDIILAAPADTTNVPPAILLASDHPTPFDFEDVIQESDGSDWIYASE